MAQKKRPYLTVCLDVWKEKRVKGNKGRRGEERGMVTPSPCLGFFKNIDIPPLCLDILKIKYFVQIFQKLSTWRRCERYGHIN